MGWPTAPRGGTFIEAIVGRKYENGKLEYRLKWKGSDEVKWVEKKYCRCYSLIEKYEEDHGDYKQMESYRKEHGENGFEGISKATIDLWNSKSNRFKAFWTRENRSQMELPKAIGLSYPNARTYTKFGTENRKRKQSRSPSGERSPHAACSRTKASSNFFASAFSYAPIFKKDSLHGGKIWTLEMYEEWLEEEGYDVRLAREPQEVEFFLGREVDRINAHYPSAEKPYFHLLTQCDPSGKTNLTDILHAVECSLVCRLFPKAFQAYSNSIAYLSMKPELLTRHARKESETTKNGEKKRRKEIEKDPIGVYYSSNGSDYLEMYYR